MESFPLVGQRPKAEHFYFQDEITVHCDRIDCGWQGYVPRNGTLAAVQRLVAGHKHSTKKAA